MNTTCENEQIILDWAKKNRLNVQIGAINELINALDLPAENSEAGRTIVQQLKAEIAKFADWMENYKSSLDGCKKNMLHELRQLSAV